MAGYRVDIDDRAFDASFPRAVLELKAAAAGYTLSTAERVVVLAKGFAPKGATLRLEESIHAAQPVSTARGMEVEVIAGGPDVRETIFMEFGTYKDRPHPYMRPALAAVAGKGATAYLGTQQQTRLLARRLKARATIRQQRKQGLPAAQARALSRGVSQQFRFRSGRRTPLA